MKTSKQRRETDADRILLSLGELPLPVPRPALVVVAGLPGTGKSKFCRELKLRSGAVILESDAVRRLLFERRAYSWFESRRVFSALHAAARKLLGAGVSCIVDATNVAEVYRRPLYDIAEERGAKLIVVEVTAPRGGRCWPGFLIRRRRPSVYPKRTSLSTSACGGNGKR